MKDNKGRPSTHHHVEVARPTTMNPVHNNANAHSSARALTQPNVPLNHHEHTSKTPADTELAKPPAINQPLGVDDPATIKAYPMSTARTSTPKMNPVKRQGFSPVMMAV